jgi:hypothetical protein
LSVEVNVSELVDFGAGSGRVILSAVVVGASRSYGYALPEDKGMKYIFDSMVMASETLTKDRVEWTGQDILDLTELNGSPSSVFSFRLGFPLPVQEDILHLCCRHAARGGRCRAVTAQVVGTRLLSAFLTTGERLETLL